MHLIPLLLISFVHGFFITRNAVLSAFTNKVKSGNVNAATAFLEKHKSHSKFVCPNELKDYQSERCVKLYDALYNNPEILKMVLDSDANIKPQAFLILTTFRAILDDNRGVFRMLLPLTRYSELAYERKKGAESMLWIDAVFLKMKGRGYLTPATFAFYSKKYDYSYLSLTRDTVDFTEKQLEIGGVSKYLRSWLIRLDKDCNPIVLGHNKPLELQQIVIEVLQKETDGCLSMMTNLLKEKDAAMSILNEKRLSNVPKAQKAIFLKIYPTLSAILTLFESRFTPTRSNFILNENLDIFYPQWRPFIIEQILFKLINFIQSNPIENDLDIPSNLLDLITLAINNKEPQDRESILLDFLSSYKSLLLPDADIDKLKLIWNKVANNLEECPICCEPMIESSKYQLPCNHIFCKDCVLLWKQAMANKASCPNCRTIF